MSARNRTITSCPGCNEALEVPLNRGDLGLMCPGCRHRWDWYAPPRPNPRRRKRLLILLLAVAVPLFGAVLVWFCLDNYIEAGRHLTPYSVRVRGYYRRDGTYVAPYHRRPPGSVAHDAPYEQTRSLCQLGMFFGVGSSLVPPFLVVRGRKKNRLTGQLGNLPFHERPPPVSTGHWPGPAARIPENPPAVEFSPPVGASMQVRPHAVDCGEGIAPHDI